MASKSKLATDIEYVGLRLGCAFINIIPYRLAMVMASLTGWCIFNVFRVNHSRTMKRLSLVFPGRCKRELGQIAWKSFANILQNAVEMMRAPRLNKKWMDKYVVDGQLYKDRLQSYVDEGHGVVIMVPHSGNWYMAAWSMAKYGLPLCSIAAKQRNPKIYAWMKSMYGDIEVFERGSAKTLVDIKRRIQSGRAFAILPDLRVREKDVEVDFFGAKANVSHAGAMFAVKCGSPIVVAMMRREKGKHVFDHIATLRPDPEAKDTKAESVRLTQEAMRLLDERIQEHPEQWFWFNKRWILEPPVSRQKESKQKNQDLPATADNNSL